MTFSVVIAVGVAMIVALVLLTLGPEESSPKRWKWTRAFFICVIGSLAAYACLTAVRELNGIRLRGKPVDATVDDLRTIKRKGTIYQVKYHFRLDQSGPIYSARDELRQPNAWTDIDSDIAKEARKTRVVRIVCDATNPWNNIPARPKLRMPILPTISWLCFGGVIVLFSLMFLIIVVFDLKLAQE